ncbi:MAG: hypothetical protein ACRDKW_07470, partial [Actinomycetota bacterium]
MPLHRLATIGTSPQAFMDLDVNASSLTTRVIVTNNLAVPVMAELRVGGAARVNATYAPGVHTVNISTGNRFNP